MINPSEVGKSGELVRLRTLESIWVQGKLRMWGRWSYIGGGSGGNMFNQLLASGKITKSAINDALRRMKKSGITKPELEAYLFGLYHESHWFVVLVNVLICAALLWARGNMARLIDALRH